MKLVRKWLFPVLTCLIVVGAAVQPARISQAQDARQFGQIYTEVLDANSVPVREAPTLLDRIALYSNQYSTGHPILSFRDGSYFYNSPQEKAAFVQSVQDQLIQADLLPAWVFEEDPFTTVEVERILLWDPEGDSAWQEPSTFFLITWGNNDKSHSKHLAVITNAETSLPIHISIFDTNISQWLPYDLDHLRTWAEQYFDLLGWEVQEMGSPSEVWEGLDYLLAGTTMHYYVMREPTAVTIQPDRNGIFRNGTATDSSSAAYDG